MPRILISYRQADTQHITGRIFDRLAFHYGRGSIFRDIDSIRPGIDFHDQISEALTEADVLLAIVGPKWLGRRGTRINDESDMVRVELETALKTRIPIIPVLIDGTKMPNAGQLPASLKKFVFRQAVTIDSGVDFDNHMDRLRREIDCILAAGTKIAEGSTVQAESRVDPGAIGDAVMPCTIVERGMVEPAEGTADNATVTEDASKAQSSRTELGIAAAVQGGSAP